MVARFLIGLFFVLALINLAPFLLFGALMWFVLVPLVYGYRGHRRSFGSAARYRRW
jgi:apolipoprotein N-acyltransferase